MSQENVIKFLRACSKDSALLEQFNHRNLPELLLHAKSMGYDFTIDELPAVVGAMEIHIIQNVMGEEVNANSSLWPRMWGKYRFQYVVEDIFNTLSEQELNQLIS
jgi:hypothetical protein